MLSITRVVPSQCDVAVPPGICLTTEFYRRGHEAAGIASDIAETDTEAVVGDPDMRRDVLAKLRLRVEMSAIPDELRAALAEGLARARAQAHYADLFDERRALVVRFDLLRVDVDFLSKTAADIGRDDAQLVFRRHIVERAHHQPAGASCSCGARVRGGERPVRSFVSKGDRTGAEVRTGARHREA